MIQTVEFRLIVRQDVTIITDVLVPRPENLGKKRSTVIESKRRWEHSDYKERRRTEAIITYPMIIAFTSLRTKSTQTLNT